MHERYDTIGIDYAKLRRPDPRIAAVLHDALGKARTVVNVGAGCGSYEPTDRAVTAVEPSAEMISQRHSAAPPAIQAHAEALPFEDGQFDAAMAVLTVHHWRDKKKGVLEMRRVSRGPVVILTYDSTVRDFWLFDYFPKLATLDDKRMPPLSDFATWLGPHDVVPVPIPHDCIDGFLGAYWRRPAAYLDPHVRAAMSSFWAIDDISRGLVRLENDIATGAWADEHAELISRDTLDLGYRIVAAR